MKRILIPISFSKSSQNSIRHGSEIFKRAHLTLVHNYPMKGYNRQYDFGKVGYEKGIIEKLQHFADKNAKHLAQGTTFLAKSGVTSEFIEQKSSLYDLIIISRKSHAFKKHGYLSDKKIFLTTKAKCPVLIMPFTKNPFKFEDCSHIWHINRNKKESKIVEKWNRSLQINQEKVEEKSLFQNSFISSFWHNIVKYQNTHKKKLLRKIDTAHDSEPIDLIILVDNDASIFTSFFKSDTIRLFCKYDVPILVLPAKT